MADPAPPSETEVSLTQVLPNLLTIAAICAGLTAIRLGIEGRYEVAVLLIIAAGVLDGLDGRLARALGSTSRMGAELDSLADFLNFGVAPALILYVWALDDTGGIGWISVLVFAVCCVTRLARFNVGSKAEGAPKSAAYFEGVPAPAGALLVMLPMYASFVFAEAPVLPPVVISAHMVIVGLLLISRIPTWSFKTARVSRRNVKFLIVGAVVVGAALLTFAWATLIALCAAYVVTVIWAWLHRPRRSR